VAPSCDWQAGGGMSSQHALQCDLRTIHIYAYRAAQCMDDRSNRVFSGPRHVAAAWLFCPAGMVRWKTMLPQAVDSDTLLRGSHIHEAVTQGCIPKQHSLRACCVLSHSPSHPQQHTGQPG
jgi:hypothetical protein